MRHFFVGSSTKVAFGAAVLAAGLAASQAQGAVIVGSPDVFSPGGDTIVSGPFSGNPNDDQGDARNFSIVTKFHDNNQPIDLVFNAQNSGGTTEYLITESVNNRTGVLWTGYTIQLGYGTGADFVQLAAFDNLDFDTSGNPGSPDNTPQPTSTAFPNRTHTSDQIFYSGGAVPNNGTSNFSFSVDVPEVTAGSAIPAAFRRNNGTGYEFTIRQIPQAIPEPAALGLLAVGAGATMLRRRRGV